MTVPIEIGTGYRFLLTWSTATPSGVFTASTLSGSSLIGVSGGTLQVGDAIAGTNIPAGAVIITAIGGGVYQISVNATGTATGVNLAVTRGTQTLYVNGLSYATANVPYSTYAYNEVQFGGNAGNNGNGVAVATDHQIANVALWGSATATAIPTASDALGLATGTLSPVSTSTPASAWWPLGGGVTGTSPLITDTAFSDLTLNQNTLSVLSGSLTSFTYAAEVTATSPVIVGAGVSKWGKSAYFGVSLAPTLNGAHLLAALASVNANPTIAVNGSAVQISGPVYNPNDNGIAIWNLECGSVDRIAAAIGGSGYVYPSVSWSGGGGSGLTLGTPVTAVGVVGYDVINGGTGFLSSPRVAIGDAAGTGTGATAIAMVNPSGQVAQVNLLTGGSNYGSPVVYISDGYGETLTVTRSGTAISAIGVTVGGFGFTSGTLAVAIVDSTGSGAIAYATASGGALTGITVLAGGTNYSASPTIIVYQPNASLTGSQAMATATASGGVVTGTRTTNMGSGYGVPPFVGVELPPNWQGPAGGIPASACVHVANGSIDYVFPAVGGLLGCGSGYTEQTPPYVQVGGVVEGGGYCSVNLAPTSLASVTVNYGGSGYTSPSVAISGGGMVGSLTATATVSGGIITAITFTGTATFTGVPTVAICDATGVHAVATAVLTGAAIASTTIGANGPRGWSATPLVAFADPTGSGATGTATLNGTGPYAVVSAVTVNTGGASYTLPSMTFTDPGISTTAASIRPIVSTYVQSIPVITGGGAFAAPPTVTVSDPTGSGYVSQVIMTGVQATDVVTYSAPASWLAPTTGGLSIGGVQAVSNASVSNWKGQYEGTTGGLWPIAVTPTMLGGANVGSAPSNSAYDRGTFRNMLHKNNLVGTPPWVYQFGTSGTISLQSDNQTPASWTRGTGNNGAIGLDFYNLVGANGIDQMGPPSHAGPWTVQYQDSQANTTNATAAWIYTAANPPNCTVTPVPLSGPSTPVVMANADVTLSGTSNAYISGITISNTPGLNPTGVSYQGAGVVITNQNGSPSSAAAVAVVDPTSGQVVQIQIVSGGSGFGTSNLPVVTVYGTLLSGTTVTAVFDVAYMASPSQWDLGLQFAIAQLGGTYNLTEPWVATPAATNGNQAITATTNNSELAVSQDVIKSLTGMGGNPAQGPFRWMDVTMGLGGGTNFVDPPDLSVPAAGSTVWGLATTTPATFCYARYFNTDPSQTEYKQADGTSYASTKLYGTTGLFTSGVDASFTNYGGMSMPSGTPYLSLPPGDAGSFLQGDGVYLAIEFRSMQPHGFKTGQNLSITAITCYLVVNVTAGGSGYSSTPTIRLSGGTGTYSSAFATVSGGVITGITVIGSCGYASSDSVTVVITDSTGTGATATAAPTSNFIVPTNVGASYGSINGSGQAVNGALSAWVTGPYTIMGRAFCGAGTIAAGFSMQTVLSTAEIPISVTMTLQIPNEGRLVPYEFAAASSPQLANSIYWCNLPPAGSNALYQTIAQKTAANIGSTAPVWLEYGNENWNSGFFTSNWQNATQNLLAYLPDGTAALTYFTGNGVRQPYPHSLNAANAFQAFASAWTGAGLNASRLKRVYGAQWGTTNSVPEALQTAQQWGLPNVDYVCVAPYIDTPAIASIVRCFSPAASWGSAVGGAASWPADAINDTVRLLMVYSTKNQTYWQADQQACQFFGQPLTPFNNVGSCATAEATLTPTTIAAVAVVTPGSTYTSPATVTLIGGGGTYTSATASMGVAATIQNKGANYTSPTVTLSGGGGTGASITLTVTSGAITGITVVPGTGYTSPPTAVISDSTGSGGSLSISLSVVSIAVAGSASYTSAPQVAISGGGTTTGVAYAVAVLAATTLASLTLTDGGNNYAVAPRVAFSDGSNAAATGTIVNGGVGPITVTNSGSGYTTTPVVLISGNGTGAQAVAIMSAGGVSKVIVTNPGSNYSGTVSIGFQVGSGATGTAALTGTAVSSVALGVGGSGYTGVPSVSILGGSAIAAGTYYACYTFVDGQGRETTVGLSRYGFGVSAINGFGTTMVGLAMPPWPPWAASLNIYLTQPNGAAGTETLYMTISAAEYGAGKTYPIGAPIGLGAAVPSSPMGASPPTTNLAASNLTQSLPRMVCYEGAVEIAIPSTVPLRMVLLHDAFAHPACADRIWTWYSMCQTGCPTAGSGSAAAVYYQMYNDLSVPPYEWCLSYGNRQAPGVGTTNRYASPQGGANFDGHDHNGGATPNQATAMQGFINWFGATATVPGTPTPTPTRKWFSGLRRPVMRVGS
ncbi:MAG: hypothetical protein ACYC61_15530 [Isosphaeraceae bacterium]